MIVLRFAVIDNGSIYFKLPAVFMRKQSSRMSQTVIPAADARIFV
jgi:hypothetical protein